MKEINSEPGFNSGNMVSKNKVLLDSCSYNDNEVIPESWEIDKMLFLIGRIDEFSDKDIEKYINSLDSEKRKLFDGFEISKDILLKLVLYISLNEEEKNFINSYAKRFSNKKGDTFALHRWEKTILLYDKLNSDYYIKKLKGLEEDS